MAGDSLIHDVAWEMAKEIVRIFAPCLREEEQLEAFREVYELVKEGLKQFQEKESRRQHRLRPLSSERNTQQ
jgi:hypothetical protein